MRLVTLVLAFALAVPGLALAESRIASAVHEVEPILHEWGYAAVAGAATLDFLGIPAPAVTILVAATLGAARGDLGLPTVFTLAVAGMIAGSQLGYGLGRWGGRTLLQHLPLAADRIGLVERRHARLGLWLQFLAPFLDGVRQLNGIVAGMLGMPWHRFALANAIAALIWASVWVGGTLIVEEHVAAALTLVHAARPWLLAIAGTIVAAAVLLLLLRRSRAEPGSPTPR
ncbi:MAG: DedA family protein [Geminicoccaceae bacterium]